MNHDKAIEEICKLIWENDHKYDSSSRGRSWDSAKIGDIPRYYDESSKSHYTRINYIINTYLELVD